MSDDNIDPTDDPAGKSPCTHPGCACQNFVSSPGSSVICLCGHGTQEHGLPF